MAEFIMNKINIPLAGITGNGAKMKAIVDKILYIYDSFSIHETNTDDADSYSVDLSWEGNTDWYIRAYNSGSDACFAYMTRGTDGEYVSTTYSRQSMLSSNGIVLETNHCGHDFVLVALFSGSYTVSFTIFKVVDQFTGAERFAVGTSSSYSGTYYDHGTLYTTDGTYTVRCNADKNANGLTYHDITAAIPVVFYADDRNLPMSGMVANGELLYYIYTGKDSKNFDSRHTKFTLGNSEFISITRNLCLKTM